MRNNPPPALAKRGLQRVEENTDSEVLPSNLLMLFFGKELEKRLMPDLDAPEPKRRRVLMPSKG